MSKMRSDSFIQEVSYEFALLFIERKGNLILKPDYHYVALYVDRICVSVLGYKRNANKVKIHCNYTLPERRGEGNFTKLLEFFVQENKGCEITADCLDSSKGIYERLGFEKVGYREFSKFNITKMRKIA